MLVSAARDALRRDHDRLRSSGTRGPLGRERTGTCLAGVGLLRHQHAGGGACHAVCVADSRVEAGRRDRRLRPARSCLFHGAGTARLARRIPRAAAARVPRRQRLLPPAAASQGAAGTGGSFPDDGHARRRRGTVPDGFVAPRPRLDVGSPSTAQQRWLAHVLPAQPPPLVLPFRDGCSGALRRSRTPRRPLVAGRAGRSHAHLAEVGSACTVDWLDRRGLLGRRRTGVACPYDRRGDGHSLRSVLLDRNGVRALLFSRPMAEPGRFDRPFHHGAGPLSVRAVQHAFGADDRRRAARGDCGSGATVAAHRRLARIASQRNRIGWLTLPRVRRLGGRWRNPCGVLGRRTPLCDPGCGARVLRSCPGHQWRFRGKPRRGHVCRARW